MNTRKQLICIFVLIGFLIPSLSAAVSAENPSEDQNFTAPHTGTDFPVGWDDLQLGVFEDQIEIRLVYPAMSSGEGKDMAGNGPFPYVQFFVDSGESSDSYMDFTTRLAQRGFIVAVHSDSYTSTDFDEVLEQTVKVHDQMGKLNNSSGVVAGSFGQFDLLHWGLSGHGIGAAAAYGVYPFWMNSSLHNQTQPPRGIFGLGIDFSDWNGMHWADLMPAGWIHSPASPSAGLFLTGTADEIYTSNDATSVLSQGDNFAWQMMEVLGADHYQFQDSTSFLEGFGDGDASLTQNEQNTIAADHVISYLDLTLRGSHEAFRHAFNRPVGPNVVSDSDAYLVEDLDDSDFLRINQTSFVPNSNATFGPQITVNSFTDWSLRDGRTYGELPGEWTLDVECRILGMEQSNGSLDSNGTAHCVFPMQDVAPGPHTAQVKIIVEGAASVHTFEFFRTDAPILTVDPVPEIEVLERGSASVDASLFGSDPDGQDLFIIASELIGNSSADFSIEVSQDKRTMTVNHLAVDEVVNGTQVNLTLRAGGGGVIDEIQITSNISIILLDDPAVKIADVPMQNLIEDGSSITLKLSDYVQDPEGGLLTATVVGASEDTYGPVSILFAEENITLTPLLNANGASVLHLLVGDGTNAPVELDIPLYVEPVNDGIFINDSAWSFSVVEDEGFYLNLSDLASDVDGDNLFWTIESTSQSVDVTRSFSQFIITPILDFSGFDNLTSINVTDGTVTIIRTLNITVTPSPDAPILTLQELNLIDATAASLQWWVYDADGVMPNSTEIQVNGTVLENLSFSCVFDATDLTNRCLSMLPIPSSHNGTVEVQVTVYDEELNLAIAATLSVNMTPSEPVVLPPTAESDGLGSLGVTLVVSMSLIILIVLLTIILALRNGGKSTPELPMVEVEQEVEQEEEEETPPRTNNGGGLLARAQQKQ